MGGWDTQFCSSSSSFSWQDFSKGKRRRRIRGRRKEAFMTEDLRRGRSKEEKGGRGRWNGYKLFLHFRCFSCSWVRSGQKSKSKLKTFQSEKQVILAILVKITIEIANFFPYFFYGREYKNCSKSLFFAIWNSRHFLVSDVSTGAQRRRTISPPSSPEKRPILPPSPERCDLNRFLPHFVPAPEGGGASSHGRKGGEKGGKGGGGRLQKERGEGGKTLARII